MQGLFIKEGGGLLAKIRDVGAQPAPSHAPPNYCAQNGHVSQLIIEGQLGNQTVPLIIHIYPM